MVKKMDSGNFSEDIQKWSSILEIMDVASELRSKTDDARTFLDIDVLREDIKNRIMDASKIKGENLTEENVDAAIDYHVSQMYKFIPPQKSFSTKIGNWYVERGSITRTIIIPGAATLGVLAGLTYGGIKVNENMKLKAERNVELAIISAENQKNAINLDANSLRLEKTYYVTPQTLEAMARDVTVELDKTSRFFERYAQGKNVSQVVTPDNYELISGQLEGERGILSIIDNAQEKLNKGINQISLDDELVNTRKSLDVIVSEIKNNDFPKALTVKSEVEYNNGVEKVKVLDISGAKGYLSNLHEIKQSGFDFKRLVPELERIYADVTAIAVEKVAIEQANNIYKDAKTQISEIDVASLNNDVMKLNNLEAVLQDELTVKIVSKEGVKSGIDRYYDGSLSGYYIILEAINESGEVVPQSITSIESGKTEKVRMWAEKVPEEVYERVKSDKLDDGLIQNNLFFEKKKGYVTMKVIFKDDSGKTLQREGQILDW